MGDVELPDLSGRVAVVTGGNTGLGLETVVALARAGAHVELAARDRSRGEGAVDDVRARVPGADVVLLDLDLADLDNVRRAADDLAGRHDAIHHLVNNAGVMMTPEATTADGFELQVGINHLGHFALTGLLLDSLLAAGEPEGAEPARVVAVSSLAHQGGQLRPFERPYDRTGAYGQSKLMNLSWALELDRRAREADVALAAVAAHPGISATELGRGMLESVPSLVRPALELVSRLTLPILAQSAEQGAKPQVYAAAAPGVEGGTYWGPDGWRELRGDVTRADVTSSARDRDAAIALWSWSEERTGVTYDALAG